MKADDLTLEELRKLFAILTAAALAFAAPVAAQQASVFGTAGLGAGTGV